jgi:uncharacterized protein (TIGR02453 family)
MTDHAFEGFPEDVLPFFQELSQNNTREWFEEHRDRYENAVLEPSRRLVEALGDRLRRHRPEIVADPRINQSLFRIFRDTRFSKDKTPLKTHLAVWLWEGARPRMECPGFYVHIEPESFLVGAGIYRFTPPLLETYRKAVDDQRSGRRLIRAIEDVLVHGDYELGGRHYKRVPRGFSADHPRADLLRHNGLYLGRETLPPPQLHTPALVDVIVDECLNMMPLHLWLVDELS